MLTRELALVRFDLDRLREGRRDPVAPQDGGGTA